MKKIELAFYDASKIKPSKKEEGLKIVIWHVQFRETANGKQPDVYDWGFAYWTGKEWESISEDGQENTFAYSSKVSWWANTVNPKILLEDSRIIKLGS